MRKKFKALRGMDDVMPKEAPVWHYIEERARAALDLYGFCEIRTPLLEDAGLFVRSVGKTTDIVQKQMYTFLDRKKRRISLRPEGTASCIRAYLEHNLDNKDSIEKLYYIGPMFRSERPQAGRKRQFYHIGVEAIGSYGPSLDADIILLLEHTLKKIGINSYVININSLGCSKDKAKIEKTIKRGLASYVNLLCRECKTRYKKNVFRVLDCKNTACKHAVRNLPDVLEQVCPDCRAHFDSVKEYLDRLDVTYKINPHLVRGLDYYTRTCFEVTHPALGSQDAIGAGGRYDNLVEDLGGSPKGAIGFALGIERLILALGEKALEYQTQAGPVIFFATLGEEAEKKALKIGNGLRKENISVEFAYIAKSLKAQLRLADKLGAKHAAILGDEELKKGTVILRDMKKSQQREIPLENLVEEVKKLC